MLVFCSLYNYRTVMYCSFLASAQNLNLNRVWGMSNRGLNNNVFRHWSIVRIETNLSSVFEISFDSNEVSKVFANISWPYRLCICMDTAPESCLLYCLAFSISGQFFVKKKSYINKYILRYTMYLYSHTIASIQKREISNTREKWTCEGLSVIFFPPTSSSYLNYFSIGIQISFERCL